MNIVFVCQWFPPEHTPIGIMLKEMAEDLSLNGHKVTIVTGYPNHPTGVVYEGFKKKLITTEMINGITVIRCYLYTSPKKNILSRLLNYVSFAASSFLVVIFMKKQDALFMVSPPLFNGFTAVLLRWIKGLKFIFNVQDIYPDVAVSMGIIKNKFVINALKKAELVIYKWASSITVISDGFKVNIMQKGIDKNKISVIPNWLDTREIKNVEKTNRFTIENNLVDKFVILYSGTIGLISGAEILVDCAEELRSYQDIVFLFVGDGIAKEHIIHESEKLKLTNMKFLPFQPREILSEVQSCADISIVTLKEGKGQTSVPSKVLGYMAAAKPIIACVDSDSDTAKLINDANCGICIKSENAKGITDAVLFLYSQRALANKMGTRGRKYLEDNFNRNKVTSMYEHEFCKVIGDVID